MPAPDDIRFGALPHDMACPLCDHQIHYSRCGDDVGFGVPCPCRCPVPGLD